MTENNSARNNIDYNEWGWRLIDENAYPFYRSNSLEPNRWLCQRAINKFGDIGNILWWWDNPDTDEGGNWVNNWNLCANIEITDPLFDKDLREYGGISIKTPNQNNVYVFYFTSTESQEICLQTARPQSLFEDAMHGGLYIKDGPGDIYAEVDFENEDDINDYLLRCISLRAKFWFDEAGANYEITNLQEGRDESFVIFEGDSTAGNEKSILDMMRIIAAEANYHAIDSVK